MVSGRETGDEGLGSVESVVGVVFPEDGQVWVVFVVVGVAGTLVTEGREAVWFGTVVVPVLVVLWTTCGSVSIVVLLE